MSVELNSITFGKSQEGWVIPKSVLMGARFQRAAPKDDEEIGLDPPIGGGDSPGDPTVDGGDSPRDPPVQIWSGVSCLLEE